MAHQTDSAADTPTAPVRASAELTHTENVSNQRRNRAALRDYYKLKSQHPPLRPSTDDGSSNGNDSNSPSPAPPASAAAAAAAHVSNNDSGSSSGSGSLLARLDDPSFDADKFVSSLLATASLQEILRTEAVLVSEIRNLDGECKALVYDNYSKLIKAVGTIGDMQRGMQKKPQQQQQYQFHRHGNNDNDNDENEAADRGKLDNVEKVEEKLQSLETMAHQIRPAGQNIFHDQVEVRRRKRRQKELVRWVLAAPNRLQILCQQADRRQDAELEWARVKQLLDRWGEQDVKGIEEVRAACARAMNNTTAPAAPAAPAPAPAADQG